MLIKQRSECCFMILVDDCFTCIQEAIDQLCCRLNLRADKLPMTNVSKHCNSCVVFGSLAEKMAGLSLSSGVGFALSQWFVLQNLDG